MPGRRVDVPPGGVHSPTQPAHCPGDCMRPRLKSLNCLAGDDTLLVSLDPRQRVELADPTGQVLAMLQLLHEGSRTPEQLRTALADRWPDLSVADVNDALEALD